MSKRKTIERVIKGAALSALYLSFPFVVFAANGTQQDEPGTISRPSILPNINAGQFITGIISLIIIIAFIAAFLYLLWGGFQWITSGGDEGAITAARGRIIQALIGLTVVVAAWAIFQLVQAAFGITILGKDLTALFRQIFPHSQ